MTIRWNERYARRTERMTSSAIRELLKITERPEFISFAGGLPAPELFPIEEVRRVSDRVLREVGPTALQYSATEGYRPLRELVAERMRVRGVQAAVDNVLITTGSQQGIDLMGKIMLDAGDRVVVESPTYLAALQSWRAYEAEFLTVPADTRGMEVEALEAVLPLRPTMVYALPNFQNPSGVTLSLQRRERLIELSRRHGLPIVEDDPYHDLRFEAEDLPTLIALDAIGSGETYAGNVVSLGTFSKILAPGLRVGWVVAAPEVIAQLTLAKQGSDLHTSTLDQMIAYEMLRSGYLAAHRKSIVETYRHRRDVMLAALEEFFPDGVCWTRPEGGMFLWVELPEEINAADLLRAAMEREVAFVPGSGFHADGSGHNTLRLNFSNAAPERIQEGIRRLREAFDDMMGRVPGVAQPADMPVREVELR